MRALLRVFRKEFIENLRDKRTLISALLFGPLFGPLLFGFMVTRTLDQNITEADVPVEITLSGSARAPALVEFLDSHGTTLTRTELSEEAARAAVRPVRARTSAEAGPRTSPCTA